MKIGFVVLALILLSACTNSGKSTANLNKAEDPEATFEWNAFSHKLLTGKIGDYAVQMELMNEDSLLRGTYFYEKTGIAITLAGKISKSGEIELNETNNQGEITAIFSGKYNAATSLSGLWGKINEKTKIPFTLTVTSNTNDVFSKTDRSNKNCSFTNNVPADEEMMPWDTMCTSLSISLIKLNSNTATSANKINQSIEKNTCTFSVGEKRVTSIDAFLKSVDESSEYGFEQEVWSNLVSLSKTTCCIEINSFYYAFGSAHPYAFGNFYNYDLATGKSIKLEDLLVPNFDRELNQIAEKIFVQTNGNDGWFYEKGKFQLNSDFAIYPSGLLFQFDAYEIGPYAAGSPSVFIPFQKISHLIKKDGLLANE